jgi:hypothetical protein
LGEPWLPYGYHGKISENPFKLFLHIKNILSLDQIRVFEFKFLKITRNMATTRPHSKGEGTNSSAGSPRFEPAPPPTF